MNKLSFIYIVIICIVTGCSKKSDPITIIEKEKIIKLIRYGSTNTGFYEYSYKNGQIFQEKYSGNSSNVPNISTYTYQTNGQLKEISADYLGKGANTRMEYIFEKDKVIRTNTYNNATNELINYTLRDYLSGKIISKTFNKLDVLIQKNEYFINPNGKNYDKMISYLGTTVSYTTNILRTDGKKNPFGLLPQGYAVFSNTNNAIDVDFIFPNTAFNQQQRYTLEYNEMGYPTKEINQAGATVRVFEYLIE